jgi:hypothetical protein
MERIDTEIAEGMVDPSNEGDLFKPNTLKDEQAESYGQRVDRM